MKASVKGPQDLLQCRDFQLARCRGFFSRTEGQGRAEDFPADAADGAEFAHGHGDDRFIGILGFDGFWNIAVSWLLPPM